MSSRQRSLMTDRNGQGSSTGEQDVSTVAAAFDLSLAPWFAIHDLWWEKLLQTAGSTGWSATMVQLQYAVAMSVPMLETAGQRARQLGPSWEPFSEWCLAHADEERDHDRWLLNDLRRAGIPVEDGGVAATEILSLVGSQLMLARSARPTAILGYVFVTECHPSEPAALDSLAARLQLPACALETVRYHAEVDPHHRNEVLKQMARYSSDASSVGAMTTSALLYLTGWASFFRSQCQRTRQPVLNRP